MGSELKIRPLGDRVVVKVFEETQTTTGGIILPDSAKEKPQRGEVIAVGGGRTLDNGNKEQMDINVGDVVLFQSNYSGTNVKFEGTEYKILSSKEILGIIE